MEAAGHMRVLQMLCNRWEQNTQTKMSTYPFKLCCFGSNPRVMRVTMQQKENVRVNNVTIKSQTVCETRLLT